MIRLHPRRGRNRYCGPAAISFLTGLTTDEAAELIRKYSGQRAVKSARTLNVLAALGDCGFGHIRRDPPAKTTLGQWINHYRRPTATYLVVAGNHFQIVSRGLFACGRIGKAVDLNRKDAGIKRRCRIVAVFELQLDRPGELQATKARLDEAAKVRRREYNKEAAPRRKVRELERSGVVEVDDYHGIMVYPNREIEHDPWEGDHDCDGSWQEALERALEYERLQKGRPAPPSCGEKTIAAS